MAQDL
jgi:hypothetical protein